MQETTSSPELRAFSVWLQSHIQKILIYSHSEHKVLFCVDVNADTLLKHETPLFIGILFV